MLRVKTHVHLGRHDGYGTLHHVPLGGVAGEGGSLSVVVVFSGWFGDQIDNALDLAAR